MQVFFSLVPLNTSSAISGRKKVTDHRKESLARGQSEDRQGENTSNV
jgi:hypothetical protein